jgi:signal transduction histidine kinase
MSEREEYLLDLTLDIELTTSSLREISRAGEGVEQSFYMGPAGNLIYPNPLARLRTDEGEFLERARQLFMDRDLASRQLSFLSNMVQPFDGFQSANAAWFNNPPGPLSPASSFFSQNRAAQSGGAFENQQIAQSALAPNPTNQRKAPLSVSQQQVLTPQQGTVAQNSNFVAQNSGMGMPPSNRTDFGHGWYAWYWGKGLNLIFWRSSPSGGVVGVELDRIAFIADIIALLPETQPEKSDSARLRMILRDAMGQALYQWGNYSPAEGEEPFAQSPLGHPLGSWRVEYYYPMESIAAIRTRSVYLNLAASMTALGFALVGLAFYFYREHSRAMRDAAQRVSFVNQVSHELKTPLTNIRMYAELLEGELTGGDEKAQRYLEVMRSESGRLSRLIGNILNFSRQQRHKLQLHPEPCRVNDLVGRVAHCFQAALERQSIRMEIDTQTPEPIMADPDVIEQILCNLISNVEKYAASGGWLRIETRREDDTTVLRVMDRGPGVAPAHRERIFRPFFRISNRLTDGVSGTGIGLSIARELARLHGGDVKLVSGNRGAVFEVRLRTPLVSESEPIQV